MFHLVARHLRLYIKDKVSLFFTFLSPLIYLLLYFAIFRKATTADAIAFADAHVAIGLIIITAFSSTITAFSTMLDDRIAKRHKDFYLCQLSNFSLSFSYIFAAAIIGLITSLISGIAGSILLYAVDQAILPATVIYKLLVMAIITSVFCALLNYVPISFMKSHGSFSAYASMFGFTGSLLAGIYVPLGLFPNYMKVISAIFPLTHPALLINRWLLPEMYTLVPSSLPDVAKTSIENALGIRLQIGDFAITTTHSIVYIAIWAFVLTVIAIATARRKEK